MLPSTPPCRLPAPTAAAAFVAECIAAEASYAAALASLGQRYTSTLAGVKPFALLSLALAHAAEVHASFERTLADQVHPLLRSQPAPGPITLQRAARLFHLAAEQSARYHLAALDASVPDSLPESLPHQAIEPPPTGATTPDSASPLTPGQPNGVLPSIGKSDLCRAQQQQQSNATLIRPVGASHNARSASPACRL